MVHPSAKNIAEAQNITGSQPELNAGEYWKPRCRSLAPQPNPFQVLPKLPLNLISATEIQRKFESDYSMIPDHSPNVQIKEKLRKITQAPPKKMATRKEIGGLNSSQISSTEPTNLKEHDLNQPIRAIQLKNLIQQHTYDCVQLIGAKIFDDTINFFRNKLKSEKETTNQDQEDVSDFINFRLHSVRDADKVRAVIWFLLNQSFILGYFTDIQGTSC